MTSDFQVGTRQISQTASDFNKQAHVLPNTNVCIFINSAESLVSNVEKRSCMLHLQFCVYMYCLMHIASPCQICSKIQKGKYFKMWQLHPSQWNIVVARRLLSQASPSKFLPQDKQDKILNFYATSFNQPTAYQSK